MSLEKRLAIGFVVFIAALVVSVVVFALLLG